MDWANLPPCKNELIEHIHRSHYICSSWNYATVLPSEDEEFPRKNKLKPEHYGWDKVDGEYKIRWYSGQMSPSSIDEMVTASEQSNQEKESDDEDDDDEVEDDSEEELSESEEEEN